MILAEVSDVAVAVAGLEVVDSVEAVSYKLRSSTHSLMNLILLILIIDYYLFIFVSF